jgi:hypothetical protein
MAIAHPILAEAHYEPQTFCVMGSLPLDVGSVSVRADRSTWRDPTDGDVLSVLLEKSKDAINYETIIGFTACGGDFFPGFGLGEVPPPNARRSLESAASTAVVHSGLGWVYRITIKILAPIRTSVNIDWS